MKVFPIVEMSCEYKYGILEDQECQCGWEYKASVVGKSGRKEVEVKFGGENFQATLNFLTEVYHDKKII